MYFPKMKVRGVSRRRRRRAAREAGKFRNFTRNYGAGAQRIIGISSPDDPETDFTLLFRPDALKRMKDAMTRMGDAAENAAEAFWVFEEGVNRRDRT